MITAKIAKEKADTTNTTVSEAQLNMLLRQIEEAADKGKFNFMTSAPLMRETLIKLDELGFIVTSGGRMNEVDYNIDWSKPKE